jgi:hypothetical protein
VFSSTDFQDTEIKNSIYSIEVVKKRHQKVLNQYLIQNLTNQKPGKDEDKSELQ